MTVLLRGDRLQRLRLASGLVLFAFAGTYLRVHAQRQFMSPAPAPSLKVIRG